jgi:hypothetical protein
MREAFFLFLGTLIGFYITVIHERLARLRDFRAKMKVFRIRLHETPDNGISAFYQSSRLEVLESCAVIHADIFWWNRARFETACATYHAAQQDEDARIQNVFVHTLYPKAAAMNPDQRTLDERIRWSLAELVRCARLGLA